MATKSFGTEIQTETPTRRDYAGEIFKAVGAHFPLQLNFDRTGNLIGANYDTEWHEGDTELTEGKNGEPVYKENYTKHKLTKDQIKTLDEYLAENVTLQS